MNQEANRSNAETAVVVPPDAELVLIKPESVSAIAYGVFISLPAREFTAQYLSGAAHIPPERRHEIGIGYGDETKTFTYDEFLTALGFKVTA